MSKEETRAKEVHRASQSSVAPDPVSTAGTLVPSSVSECEDGESLIWDTRARSSSCVRCMHTEGNTLKNKSLCLELCSLASPSFYVLPKQEKKKKNRTDTEKKSVLTWKFSFEILQEGRDERHGEGT